MSDLKSVSPAGAQHLIERNALVLDVRTPEEFARLGHIPGAWLLPVDLIASAPAVLPPEDRPLIVCCEHGVRSVAAARWLIAAGTANVINMAGGMSNWTGARVFGPQPIAGPAGWLLENAHLLPRRGEILDLACGRGRHALTLAAAGFRVCAIDRDESAVASLSRVAARLELPIDARVVDLETGTIDLGNASYEAILVFNYLHRPLMPAIVRALVPGGALIYETFTIGQAERGHPRNPAFLLKPGELPTLIAPLTVERSREGEVDGKLVASVVARKMS
ncbi:MAG: rhodanese-like domain-containing protein [Vicinamibacterales bacterium]